MPAAERRAVVCWSMITKSCGSSLREWLTASLPACLILEAETGEQGVALALAHRPVAVLMDIGLPGISGIETARRISHAAPEVAVVMLSSHNTSAHREDAAQAGAAAYVAKSAIYTELLPILARYWPSPPNPGGPDHTQEN